MDWRPTRQRTKSVIARCGGDRFSAPPSGVGTTITVASSRKGQCRRLKSAITVTKETASRQDGSLVHETYGEGRITVRLRQQTSKVGHFADAGEQVGSAVGAGPVRVALIWTRSSTPNEALTQRRAERRPA